jgi:hypothetical protein
MKKLLKLISNFIYRKDKEHFSGLKIFTDDPEFQNRIFDPYKLDFEGEEFRNILIPHPDFAKWLTEASLNDSLIDEILQIKPIYGKNLSTRQLLLEGYNVIKALLNYFHKPLVIDSNLDIILSTFLLKCFTNPVKKLESIFPKENYGMPKF